MPGSGLHNYSTGMNWNEKIPGRWKWTDRQVRSLGAALVLTSGMAYLRWGGGSQSAFLFEMEGTVLEKLTTDPLSVLHPFVILPMSGQLLLIGNTLLPRPRPGILLAGLALLGSLLSFVLLAGILGKDPAVAGSCIPFLSVAIWGGRAGWRRRHTG